jgi:two-component system chemotaxis sensor kinase CheA
MDAQVKKSLLDLKVEIPKIHNTLAKCRSSMAKGDVEPPHDLEASLLQTIDNLQIILSWINPNHSSKLAPSKSISPKIHADDLTPEEAQVLLEGLSEEESSTNLFTKDQQHDAQKHKLKSQEELADEEAFALLEQGQNISVGGSIQSTRLNPALNTGDMSDEEARRLLEAMDAPLETPKSPKLDQDDATEMSDEEARKLLAAMDEPISAPSINTNTTEFSSADDEALAMLKAMGGDETGTEIPTPSPPPKQSNTHQVTEEDSGSSEVLSEIEEFSKNDFASDPDMMRDFGQNSDELMETLDQTILQLEQNPRDKETIESIFRAAHTLKGAAGMFGFKAMERVMHRMENLFDQVRKGILIPNADTIDVVFQGLDLLRKLLEAAKSGNPSGVPTVPIVKALELASTGKYSKGSLAPGPTTKKPDQNQAANNPAHPATGGEHADQTKKTEQSTIRVDLERLDMLVNLVGELVIDRTRFASLDETLRTTNPQLKVVGAFSETVQLFGRHMNEIHEIIMKIRMVPIGNAFNKFTRVVRDLARQLEKDINLTISGEDTELDKTLVEQIGDPLIHLIRNSCDHGVEPPETRIAAGKPRAGIISLSARQEGNHIIITIRDDGKGIQVDAVKRKAIEKGLITEDATLSKREIFNLIFEPGFSTAEKITTVSGRGVGMDVVRKQISKLKGIIEIDSEIGQGTTTTIRLPLTLAIVQSLLVESSGDIFAIPLSTVIESVRINPSDIQSIGDAEVIKRHGNVLPLMHLHENLDLGDKHQNSWYVAESHRDEDKINAQTKNIRKKDRLFVVIVGTADRRFGIVVDQLLHQQEMVIKSMGPLMKRVPCVAGGSVLGNGEVVLVLDIQELEDKFRARSKSKRDIKASPQYAS